MDVFKELIDELKQENLLEDTIAYSEHNSFEFTAAETAAESSYIRAAEFEGAVSAGPPVNAGPGDDEGSVDLTDQAGHDGNDKDFAISTVKPSNGREFYKKRAVGEMSHLQMVEHVLTGVEREYMKIVPKIFDDFAAKKALHAFLKVSEDENSPQHSEAEFALMEETEAWVGSPGTELEFAL